MKPLAFPVARFVCDPNRERDGNPNGCCCHTSDNHRRRLLMVAINYLEKANDQGY